MQRAHPVCAGGRREQRQRFGQPRLQPDDVGGAAGRLPARAARALQAAQGAHAPRALQRHHPAWPAESRPAHAVHRAPFVPRLAPDVERRVGTARVLPAALLPRFRRQLLHLQHVRPPVPTGAAPAVRPLSLHALQVQVAPAAAPQALQAELRSMGSARTSKLS